MSRGLGVEVEVGRADLRYLAGEVTLHDVVVVKCLSPGAPPQPILRAETIGGRLDLARLLRGEIRLASLAIRRPVLRIEIDERGRSVLDRVRAEAPWLARGAGERRSAWPRAIAIGDLVVGDSVIEWRGHAGGPAVETTLSISTLAAEVTELSPGVFRGRFSLGGLSIVRSGEPLAALDGLRIAARRLAPAERDFEFSSVEIFGPVLSLERRPDGRVEVLGFTSGAPVDFLRKGAPARSLESVTQAAQPQGESGARGGPPPDLPLVAIDRLRLCGGRLEMRDRGVEPQVSLDPTGIDIAAERLTTAGWRGQAAGRASVRLRFSDPAIVGSVRLDTLLRLAPPVEGEVAAHVTGLRLAPLAPYLVAAGKIAPRAGIANVESTVTLGPQRFESRHWIRAAGLELGGAGHVSRRLDGKTPVSLEAALALLEDDRGVIDLRVPFSGSRDRPSVALLGLFGAAVEHALVTAVRKFVSPLQRLLESLPDRETTFRFERIHFDPGSAALPRGALGPLARTAAFLERRPEVAIDIRGGADPASDLPAATLLAATIDPEEPSNVEAALRPIAGEEGGFGACGRAVEIGLLGEGE